MGKPGERVGEGKGGESENGLAESGVRDALTKFPAPGGLDGPEPGFELLNKLVEKALIEADGMKLADLSLVPDETLAQDDTVFRARVVLVLAYLKVSGFLRAKPTSPGMALEQAKLGMAFIKHAENVPDHGLRIPGEGRTVNDRVLRDQVVEMRENLTRIVRLRESGGEAGSPVRAKVVDAEVVREQGNG